MASLELKNEEGSVPWQNKYVWQDRLKFLLESGKLADCEILIGEQRERFKCHKLNLAMASPVFEHVFYAQKREEEKGQSGVSVVEFLDVNVQTFCQLLNFIYLHEIDKALFPFNKVGKLLYAANKFKMNDFRLACLQYLNTNVWPIRHIFSIYNAARYHKETLLLNAANQHIVAQKDQLLNHSELYALSLDTFKNVMQLFICSCSAIVIFESVEKYCLQNELIKSDLLKQENHTISSEDICTKPLDTKEHSSSIDECSKSSAIETDLCESFSRNKFGLLSSYESRREKIKELCELIQFDKMSPKEFASGPATSKLLDRDESFEILLRICKRHQCNGELFQFSALTLKK